MEETTKKGIDIPLDAMLRRLFAAAANGERDVETSKAATSAAGSPEELRCRLTCGMACFGTQSRRQGARVICRSDLQEKRRHVEYARPGAGDVEGRLSLLRLTVFAFLTALAHPLAVLLFLALLSRLILLAALLTTLTTAQRRRHHRRQLSHGPRRRHSRNVLVGESQPLVALCLRRLDAACARRGSRACCDRDDVRAYRAGTDW